MTPDDPLADVVGTDGGTGPGARGVGHPPGAAPGTPGRGPVRRIRRVVGRLLRPRGLGRMRRPGAHDRYRTLAVADVDLSSGTATLLPPLGPYEFPPEGVHALVWFHGEPVGEVTVAGAPDALLPSLPSVAAREVQHSVEAHLLRDALATPGGVRRGAEEGLDALPHPGGPELDGSQVTVAVCTRDRPEDLQRCLAALGHLATKPAEVLVVDNASRDDRTRRVAQDLGVRYVREPRAGLDWARNRALLEARTAIVAFTDDDVLVHPGWLDGLLRAFAEEPDAVAVTGLVVPAELTTPAQVLFEAQGGFGRGYLRKWMSVAVAAGDVAAQFYPGTGGAGTGANMALRREEALALGGFDPALDVGTPTGGGGDLEMYFRVLAAGHLLVYEPTAVVRHVHRRTIPQLQRQMRGHGTGSYSIFVGAGLRYGRVQAREFLRFGARWAVEHHLRIHLRSLLWPRLWPWSMARAETAGMVGAVLGRYYSRALGQAAAESARHPSEPQTSPLVRVPASPRPPRRTEPVITLDLLHDDLVDGDPAPPVESSRRTRRMRVQVTRDGHPQAAFPVWSAGSRPSVARLRAEVAAWLGPALLEPGRDWTDPLTDVTPRTTAAAVGTPGAAARTPSRPDGRLTVSVLIATKDRPAPLRRSVEALLRGNGTRDVQVVVVDNSPDPTTTIQVLRDLPEVVVLHEPRPGLSRARNRGLPALTGDVVVFVDDDVVTTPGWLESLLEPFAEPSVWAVTGNVLPADLDVLESQVFEDYGGLGRGPHRRVFTPAWLRQGWGPAPTWHIGATANAALRRETLERLGPFDEALGAGRPAGVGEDTEYFYRVLHAGGVIVYQPTAVVLHHHRSDRAQLRRQLRAYSAGHVAYHLEILARYGDVRGLGRILFTLPRHYAFRLRRILRGVEDYPGDLLATEVRGALGGVSAWVRSRVSG